MPGRIVRKATYARPVSRPPEKRWRSLLPRRSLQGLLFVRDCILLAIASGCRVLRPLRPVRPTRSNDHPNRSASRFFLLVDLCGALVASPGYGDARAADWPGRRAFSHFYHIPFVFGEGERSWRRRPGRGSHILFVAVALGTFTQLAWHAPWSPVMDAWSGDPIPAAFLQNRTALERQGALIFQLKQCHNCHSLGNEGGKRGPALDSIALCSNRRPAHSPGNSGRREYARFRKKSQSPGNNCARRVSQNSPPCRTTAGPGCSRAHSRIRRRRPLLAGSFDHVARRAVPPKGMVTASRA